MPCQFRALPVYFMYVSIPCNVRVRVRVNSGPACFEVFFCVPPAPKRKLGGGVGGLTNTDYAVPDRPGVDAVGVHINLFVLAYVVYCTMYTAVPPFWSTD